MQPEPEPQTTAAAVNGNGNDNHNGTESSTSSSNTMAAGTPADGISADEIALYDRQIRLWGMKAQERIRSANVLVITMKALGNEVAKNLVLAGIGSLTVVDHEVVTLPDLGAQFFVEEEHVGQNRAEAASAGIRKLNPRVRVAVDTGDIRQKGPSFFAPFDMVIATDLDSPTLQVINTATRLNGRALYAAATYGMYGFIFADLIEHVFVLERAKSNVTAMPGPEGKSRTRSIVSVQPKPGDVTQELVTKREIYSTWYLASDGARLPEEMRTSPRRRRVVTPVLSCLRALWEFQQLYGRAPLATREERDAFTALCDAKHTALGLPTETLRSEVLRAFEQNVGSEVSPVAAVLGGQLAQDVINVLGANQQPIQNFVIFDGNTMEANVYPLHPDGELGVKQLSASNGDPAAIMNAEAEILGAAAAAAAMPPMPMPIDTSQAVVLD